MHEFWAVVTHPRIYVPPTLDDLMGVPGVSLLGETREHWEVLRALLARGGVTGARVHDARIAAICLAHGVQEL